MTPTEAASTLRALGWRCEPPEVLAAPTLAPDGEAAVAPPQAPRVGEVWEAPEGERRSVFVVTDHHVAWRASDRVQYTRTLADWHAWVRRSGAKVVG